MPRYELWARDGFAGDYGHHDEYLFSFSTQEKAEEYKRLIEEEKIETPSVIAEYDEFEGYDIIEIDENSFAGDEELQRELEKLKQKEEW